MKALVLFLLLTLPTQAFSANWTLLMASNDDELEIDIASVRDKKAAWFKRIYTPPQNKCSNLKKEVQSEKFYVEARCKEFTIRVKQVIVYEPNGDVVAECTYDNPKGEFSEYAPETQGEGYFTAICNAKARVANKYAENIRLKKAQDIFVINEPCPSSSEASTKCEGYSIEFIIPPCMSGAGAAAVDNFKWVEKNEVAQYNRKQKKDWGCK